MKPILLDICRRKKHSGMHSMRTIQRMHGTSMDAEFAYKSFNYTTHIHTYSLTQFFSMIFENLFYPHEWRHHFLSSTSFWARFFTGSKPHGSGQMYFWRLKPYKHFLRNKFFWREKHTLINLFKYLFSI